MESPLYRQTTSQSCLVVCLFLLAGVEVDRKRELEILIKSWEIDRENYVFSAPLVFSQKYSKEIILFVHYKVYSKVLMGLSQSSLVSIHHQKITGKFIDDHVPCAVYLDYFGLFESVRGPHFVIIEDAKKDSYLIVDPWSGKRHLIEKKFILQAIESLRKNLRFSPIVVVVK